MSSELLELFLKEDADAHARSVLARAIDARSDERVRQQFSFDRFNVMLDFVAQHAVIDDEINPEHAECVVPLAEFRRRLEE